MANPLDEMNDPVLEGGRDVNVIAKQVPVKVGVGSTIFEVLLWVLLIIPGVVFLFKKIKAGTYLRQLDQKINSYASTVDNYLEQRVVILSNLAQLVNKAVELDKDVYVSIAEARAGRPVTSGLTDEQRVNMDTQANTLNTRLNLAIENYPELKAHKDIQDAIQQNAYLQKEITAAREAYNDAVNTWNTQVQIWPTNMIVAARAGYTTRVPFSTTKEIKEKARDVFF